MNSIYCVLPSIFVAQIIYFPIIATIACPKAMMLLILVLSSLFYLCRAYYIPSNGHWPHQSSSVSLASLSTTTITAETQPPSSIDTLQDTATPTSTIPSATSAPSTSPTYIGDITHYEVGLGSCGTTNTDSQAVVALSVAMMANGANPNANPKCQAKITLINPISGSHTSATVVDTCQACAYEDVDLSPSLFVAVAPTGDGRVHGIQRSFVT